MPDRIRFTLCLLLIMVLAGCGFAEAGTTPSSGSFPHLFSNPPTMPATGSTGSVVSPTFPATIPTIPAVPTTPTIPTEPTIPTVSTVPTQPPEPVDEIAILLSGMTLREKVGQLFIVAPEALESGTNRPSYNITAVSDTIRQQLKKYPVGGIILFAGNIIDPEQILTFNAAWQEASSIPLFLCVDEEGGLVARLARNSNFDLPKYKNAATVGASGDPADGLEMGTTIGAYLKHYGFNLNFAPVADVNTNPKNTVIGNRAFSSDPTIAAKMVAAVAQGLRGEGIIATFKHFPGHGDTAEDSHYGIAVSNKTEAEMLSCEWLPFLQATENDCIMTGHIAAPQITGDMTPATLSYQMVTEILKGKLGFRGLVVTDSLSMGAITEAYTSGEAALAALQAGCDLLLMPKSLPQAFDAIVSAVEDGTITEDQLDAIVYRILAFKQAHGIL